MDVLEGGPPQRRARLGTPDGWGVPPGRGGALAALAAALVVAVLGAALGWGISAYRDRPDPAEQAVADAVERYTGALKAHDAGAVAAAMSARGVFSAGEALERPLVGPLRGRELTELLERLFGASLRVETTGDLQIVGSGPYQVTVPQRISYQARGIPVVEEGVSLFTVVVGGGPPVVERHVWWRPYGGVKPSMLWVE